MAGEGVVHDHVAAPLSSLIGNLVAAADLVNSQNDVRHSGDVRRILGGNAVDQQNVIAAEALLDLGEGGNRALDALNEDDGLDVGIAGESDQLGNGGLDLGREVVRVGVMQHLAGMLLGQLGGCGEFLFALGGGAGQDGDLVAGSFFGGGEGSHGQNHQCGQQRAKQLLHLMSPPHFFRFAARRRGCSGKTTYYPA